MTAWFIFKLESKGFFLAVTFFILAYFVVDFRRGRNWVWLSAVILACSLTWLTANSVRDNNRYVENRALSAFAQIDRGLNLIKDGGSQETDSTGQRAAMYLYGLEELKSNLVLGVGVAGIATKLSTEADLYEESSELYAFHNFFLEMLIDLGVVVFSILMMFYTWLAFRLIKLSRHQSNKVAAYLAKASGLSLITILVASISPSSIIYILTFWVVIGLALGVYFCLTERESTREYV